MLADFGLDPIEERLYRALLTTSPQSLSDLACALDVAVEELHGPRERLLARGFIVALTDGADVYLPTPPDLALHVAVSQEEFALRRRIRDLTRLRAATRSTVRDLLGDDGMQTPDNCLVLIDGVAAVRQAVADVVKLAEHRLRIIDLDPLSDTAPATGLDIARQRICQRSAVDDPAQFDLICRRQRGGDDVRLLPHPPVRAVIADDATALVVIDENPDTYRGALLRPSRFLASIVTLYDLLWERGIPLELTSGEQRRWRISDEDAALLQLLAAGLKDQAIARHLGIGLRTVVRRIGNLSRALDADTRFQAGLQAARRGLL